MFIAADHKEMVVNLYLSDTNGQFYVPSLRNVVSTIEDPWLDVDLYEVSQFCVVMVTYRCRFV